MIQVIMGFIKKEMLQTLRDPRMRTLLFIAPCIQMTLFGIALSTETRNVRLAVNSSATDELLDNIRERALASGWFLDAHQDGAGDPFSLIRDNKADVVLVPPAMGLSDAVQRGDANLQILIDATNVTRALGINRYLSAIVQKASAGSISAEGYQLPVSPLSFDFRLLYNPSLRSAVFLVPGIMSVVMCLITILLTSMSIVREKEFGTFETIIAAPLRSKEVILGKTVPYIILGLANIPLILSVAIFAFDVPMQGSIGTLIGASLIFICATVAIGIFISTITQTQQQAMLGGFIYLMPSLLISGLIAPVNNMPTPLQVLAYLNPLTYYMELLRNIMLKGGDETLVLKNAMIMILITLVIATISIKRFKTRL